jgi:hypothetical protein
VIGAWALAGLLAQAPVASPPPAAEASTQVSNPDSPVAVTTRLTPDPSQIGDILQLEIIAAYPQGFSVNLPIGLDLSPLEVVSVDEAEAESSGAGLRKTFTLKLQQFGVGEARVPDFPLTYVDLQGRVETMQVEGRAFSVDSLLANEADPQRQGEDPPISLEYPNELAETIIYVVALVVILAIALALILVAIVTRKKPIVVAPPVPPHLRAFEALDELARRRHDMIEAGQFQDYYVELTEVAKGYVEDRFGFEALDRTTDEIRRDLGRAAERIAPLRAADLISFLQECDLVKFARFAPPADETEEALGTVRRMVEDTVPRPKLDAAESKDEPEPKKEVA